jgi:hypothetical protein
MAKYKITLSMPDWDPRMQFQPAAYGKSFVRKKSQMQTSITNQRHIRIMKIYTKTW